MEVNFYDLNGPFLYADKRIFMDLVLSQANIAKVILVFCNKY